MKKIAAVTIFAPVLSLALAPVHDQGDRRPHPEHAEERPASEPERLVGKANVIFYTSAERLSPGELPSSWPPPPPDLLPGG